MKYLALPLLLLFSSCLNKADDLDLTSNPFDIDYGGNFYLLNKMECLVDDNGSDIAVISFRPKKDVMLKLYDNVELRNNLFFRVWKKSEKENIRSSRRVEDLIDGELQGVAFFHSEEDPPAKIVLEIVEREFPWSFKEEEITIWHSGEHNLNCF